MPKVFAIGIESLHADAGAVSYEHGHAVSLDDADVVFFGLPQPPTASERYQGKPSLDNFQSFRYSELLTRWRTELKAAIGAGKTVFVELTSPEVVYVETGNVDRSGTGRNARTTTYVTDASNMEAIPYPLKGVVAGAGSEIRSA